MSFKTLHTFTVTTKQMVPETVDRVESGKTVKVTTDVERETQHVVIMKEPSRREKQDVALFQQVMFNDAVRKGLLTRAAMQRELARHSSDPVSPEDDKNLAKMQVDLQRMADEVALLGMVTNDDPDDKKTKREKLLVEFVTLSKKVEDISSAYQSVYANTAETYAQTKTLSWLTLFLTYIKKGTDVKMEPFFAGADFVARENCAADLDDAADLLYRAVMEKLPTYWMCYLFKRANTPEEFTAIEAEIAKHEAAEAKPRTEAGVQREQPIQEPVVSIVAGAAVDVPVEQPEAAPVVA